MRHYKFISITAVSLVVVFAVAFYAIGFTGPVSAPPTGNVALPLNTGNVGQSKEGGLILNTGGATNGLIIQNGKVGIKTSSPTEELEVNGDIKASGTVCDSNGCIGDGGGSGSADKVVYLSPNNMIQYNVVLPVIAGTTKAILNTYSISLNSVKSAVGETRNIKGLLAKLQMVSVDADVLGGDLSLVVKPLDSEYPGQSPFGDKFVYLAESYRTYTGYINGYMRFSEDAYLIDPNGNGNVELWAGLAIRPGAGNLTINKTLNIVIFGYVTD